MSSLELCQKALKDKNCEEINVDTYLEYIAEEEEKGKQFVEIKEIIDDFTEYTGLRNYVQGSEYVARIFSNPKLLGIVSAMWLMTCIFLPIFVMLESYASDGFVSFQIVGFYLIWIMVMLVPFLKYHFVDKNRGDN